MTKNLEEMSNQELVELYNSLSDTPVARFSTRGAGIKRIQKLMEVTTENGESALLDEPKVFQANENTSLFDQPGDCGCGSHEGAEPAPAKGELRFVDDGPALYWPPKAEPAPAKEPKPKKVPGPKVERTNKLMDLKANKEKPSVKPRPGSKRAQLIDLMLRPGGVTRVEMMKQFTWSEADCRDAVYRVNKIDNFDVKEIQTGVYTAVDSAFKS